MNWEKAEATIAQTLQFEHVLVVQHYFSHFVHFILRKNLFLFSFTNLDASMNLAPSQKHQTVEFFYSQRRKNVQTKSKQTNKYTHIRTHSVTIRTRRVTCDAHYRRACIQYTSTIKSNIVWFLIVTFQHFFCTNMWNQSTCVLSSYSVYFDELTMINWYSDEQNKCFSVIWRITSHLCGTDSAILIRNSYLVLLLIDCYLTFHRKTLNTFFIMIHLFHFTLHCQQSKKNEISLSLKMITNLLNYIKWAWLCR